jgi:Family of unknown function (DUF6516)
MVTIIVNARSILDNRIALTEISFVELVVWEVPAPVRGSNHFFKYRLALVADGECVLRYDNEAGKGDHKHIGSAELPYQFQDIEKLKDDFLKDVEQWLKK